MPHTGSEEWTHDLGFDVAKPWRPWVRTNGTAAAGEEEARIGGSRVMGYVTGFGGAARDFSFATILGAGHEVPTFRPESAAVMITRFRKGEPLAP